MPALTGGVGADSGLECVGTKESMMQSIHSCRRGGHVSYVGVPHGVALDGEELFYAHVHLHGGPANGGFFDLSGLPFDPW